MSFSKYYSLKDEIEEVISNIPTGKKYDIITTDYINKYIDYFEYLQSKFGVEPWRWFMRVNDGDIIYPFHFTQLCMDTRIMGYYLAEKIIHDTINELGDYPQWQNAGNTVVMDKLSIDIMHKLSKLNYVYRDKLEEDINKYAKMEIFSERFYTIPMSGGKYLDVWTYGDLRTEDGKLYLSPGGRYLLYTYAMLVYTPCLVRHITEIPEDRDGAVALCFILNTLGSGYVWDEGYDTYMYIDVDFIYIVCYRDEWEHILEEDYFEFYIDFRGKINQIDFLIYPNKIVYLINGEPICELELAGTPIGRAYHIVFYMRNSTNHEIYVDDIFVYWLYLLPEISTGDLILVDEWNKIKSVIESTHRITSVLSEQYVSNPFPVVLYDHFDQLPSSQVWDRKCVISGNVASVNGKLRLAPNSYIELEKNIQTGYTVAFGLSFNNTINTGLNCDILVGYAHEDGSYSCLTGIVLRDTYHSIGGRGSNHPISSAIVDTLKHGDIYYIYEVFDGRYAMGVGKGANYWTKFTHFLLYAYNRSSSPNYLYIDYVYAKKSIIDYYDDLFVPIE